MNVSVSIPDELETTLRRRAAATGTDVAAVIQEIVTEQLREGEQQTRSLVSPEVFAERSAAWIRLHPVLDHAIDDSRESIYAGRGE